jgi:homoserine dehydrogenase
MGDTEKHPLGIGLAGLGTVGVGVLKVLREQSSLVSARAGREVVLRAVSAQNPGKDRGVSLEGLEWCDNALDLADVNGVDVVVELIGGADGIAKALVEKSLNQGKDVVTANKALIAHHGVNLARSAEEKGLRLAFEASVAGGVPVIKALREGLSANRLDRVYGILNGTCNYILSAMRDRGLEFPEVLSEAQKLGYAEADPAFDIDGVDAAHKLAILATVVFGAEVDFKSVHVEGIRHVSLDDIKFAEELGYRIKLLGIAENAGEGIELRVHPSMVSQAAPIARVEGVFNAVVADGETIDTVMLEGRGAGEGPTASAVVADIVDIARGLQVPTFGTAADKMTVAKISPMESHQGAYYVRLTVVDRPGVFAEVAAVLREHSVSMEAILQRGRDPGEAVPVVMVLHETVEAKMTKVLQAIRTLDGVTEDPRMIRIESF